MLCGTDKHLWPLQAFMSFLEDDRDLHIVCRDSKSQCLKLAVFEHLFTQDNQWLDS